MGEIDRQTDRQWTPLDSTTFDQRSVLPTTTRMRHGDIFIVRTKSYRDLDRLGPPPLSETVACLSCLFRHSTPVTMDTGLVSFCFLSGQTSTVRRCGCGVDHPLSRHSTSIIIYVMHDRQIDDNICASLARGVRPTGSHDV